MNRLKGINTMKKILDGMICVIIGTAIMTMMFICILTPEKTNKGEYTQPFKYWTDNTYFNENFK